MTSAQKSRPSGKTRAAKSFGGDTTSLPDPADLLNGVYVVLVAKKIPGQVRYNRRVYFNLPSAQRAADRATERGQAATVTLCRLAPHHTFNGGWGQ